MSPPPGPVALTWSSWGSLAAGVLAVIALLYLLKPRRRRVEVPFGGLWRRVIRRAEARVLGRSWRRLLSWLLMTAIAAAQLAAMGEGLLGLRGCVESPPAQGHSTVLILDTSASMQAMDGRSVGARASGARLRRLDEALDRALDIIAAARPGERFLLLSADGRTRVRSPWTDDSELLGRAIGAIRATDAGMDLERALQVARDALLGKPGGRIVLLSDDGPPELSSAGGPPVQRVRVGPPPPPRGAGPEARAVANLAIERVQLRPTPGDPSRGTLLARVRNDSAAKVLARVRVSSSSTARSAADFARAGALRALRELDLPPRCAITVGFEGLELADSRFAVTVRPAPGAELRDIAAYDDTGFAVLGARRDLGVLLVSAGNFFLESALRADDRLRVRLLAPDRYRPRAYAGARRREHGIDVVVLDQVDRELPAGTPGLRLLLRGSDPRAIRRGPDLLIRAPEHPVMAGVVFQDTNVDAARVLHTAPGDRVLVTDERGEPLLVARDRGTRTLRAGLDLLETDLVGRFAMPLLMSNAIDWLVGQEQPLVSPLTVGRVWGVEVPVSGRTWRWFPPGRPPRAARVAGRMITATSGLNGIHEWRAGEVVVARPTRIDERERPDLRPRRGSPWKPPPASAQRRNLPPPRRIWRLLLLAAALALALEWFLYMRRRTV